MPAFFQERLPGRKKPERKRRYAANSALPEQFFLLSAQSIEEKASKEALDCAQNVLDSLKKVWQHVGQREGAVSLWPRVSYFPAEMLQKRSIRNHKRGNAF